MGQVMAVSKVKRVLVGMGLAAAVALPVLALPGSASAQCYTTCAPPVHITVVPPTQLPFTGSAGNDGGVSTTSSTSQSSSLPFTGADVEEIAALGLGSLLIGGVLVRRGRRHNQPLS